nr:hypothetical protein [Lachnospiraceae bacterium]
MRRLTAFTLTAALILSLLVGCGDKKKEPPVSQTSVTGSVSVSSAGPGDDKNTTDVSTNSAGDNEEKEKPALSPWSDKVFTKEEVQAKIDGGLSDNWENYQLNAVLQNLYGLPENVLSSMENAFGAYKWESYEGIFINSWKDYFDDNSERDTAVNKLHAVLDLYGVTPDTAFPALSQEELERRVADNPKIDMSQYATYEDGDAFFSYFSYYGCEVLAQNDYVKIEGVRDITVDPYELINRVAKITNISDGPVYIRYAFIDK